MPYGKIIFLCFLGILLSGCNPARLDIGTVAGAAAGAYAGSAIGGGGGQMAAIAIGALLGSYLGGAIGQYMNGLDHHKIQEALESSPTGSTTNWTNPETGMSFNVTPTHTYNSDKGLCRKYTTEAVSSGQTEVIHDTACRQADGTWQTIN
jgi:surface antigen